MAEQNATYDLQMATFRSRGHSLCCPLVSAILASYRDVDERSLDADCTTIWRWIERYAAELDERTRPHLKPTNKSGRVDETYVRTKKRWFYRGMAGRSFGTNGLSHDVAGPNRTRVFPTRGV